MRLIDAGKLLKELSKSSTVSKVDVQIIVSNMPGVEAVPLDYHERCLGLAERQKIKLAKELKMAQETNRRILENYTPVVRCKDCVRWAHLPSGLRRNREKAGWCLLRGNTVLPDDFCSNGERMGEVNDKG